MIRHTHSTINPSSFAFGLHRLDEILKSLTVLSLFDLFLPLELPPERVGLFLEKILGLGDDMLDLLLAVLLLEALKYLLGRPLQHCTLSVDVARQIL